MWQQKKLDRGWRPPRLQRESKPFRNKELAPRKLARSTLIIEVSGGACVVVLYRCAVCAPAVQEPLLLAATTTNDDDAHIRGAASIATGVAAGRVVIVPARRNRCLLS
eukprot:1181795-Prorocentrum_minimum.AAC.1